MRSDLHFQRCAPALRFATRFFRARGMFAALVAIACANGVGVAATGAAEDSRPTAVLIEVEGRVTISRAGSIEWRPARTNEVLLPRDRVQTHENSRAVIQLDGKSNLRLGPDSRVQLPDRRDRDGVLQLFRGLLYYFHRDKPGTLPVKTPTAYAVTLGTEFAVVVGPDDSTRIDLIDGRVEVTNEFGPLMLTSGEAAIAVAGRPPARTPALRAVQAVQWVLHYPVVVEPSELEFPAAERLALNAIIESYRRGELAVALAALDALPAASAPSPEFRVFRAALVLSAGDIVASARLLPAETNATVKPLTHAVASAVRTLIAAVQADPTGVSAPAAEGAVPFESRVRRGRPSRATPPGTGVGPSTSALIAGSYFEQSRHRLGEARELARQATIASPEFGPAWARLAELEFSHGERVATEWALERALRLSPGHAAAQALQGFVHAAALRMREARQAFERAIALDGSLGMAWLGRGLVRIRLGDRDGGREDLLTAATIEPQRADFRSYLGKAYGDGLFADGARASHELELARQLDAEDPTGWFYSALQGRDGNRINRAVRDLEHAIELNGGRQVYRSRQLLDQDEAVQGAALAGLYLDAGLNAWAESMAGRAVQLDPANEAAHLFLADSHQRRRDPGRVAQRHETAAVTEYLLAHLLSPIGAGTLARSVTAHEYSRLFAADGPRFSSATEYLSRGAWTQAAVHEGTMGRSSYALSGSYQRDPGERLNDGFEQHEISAQFQQQVTPADRIYLQIVQGEIAGGDLAARRDPAAANPTLRVTERQEPVVLAGYLREWGPGHQTLGLASWVAGSQGLRNERQGTLLVDKSIDGTNASYALPAEVDQRYAARVSLFSAELQQIWSRERQALVVGGRFQDGRLNVENAAQNLTIPSVPGPPISVGSQEIETELRRGSGYGYYQLEPVSSVLLVAGLSYDWLNYPKNFRFAPVAAGELEARQVSPKGGAIWRPNPRTTVRGGYSQSLGGVGFDQSIRLEPTQVAGFNQAFRSLIPESVAGANSAASFETAGVALERRIGRGTFVALAGEWLRSEVERALGVYDFSGTIAASTTRERLGFDERTLTVSAHQLWGDDWAFGVGYRASRAELRGHFTGLPESPSVLVPGAVEARSAADAWLHQVHADARYHHASGFFALGEVIWRRQVNDGSAGAMGVPDEDFWQVNVQGGWRGWRRRVELRAGMLNLFDRDYRLTALNLAGELPRDRVLMVSVRLQF